MEWILYHMDIKIYQKMNKIKKDFFLVYNIVSTMIEKENNKLSLIIINPSSQKKKEKKRKKKES